MLLPCQAVLRPRHRHGICGVQRKGALNREEQQYTPRPPHAQRPAAEAVARVPVPPWSHLSGDCEPTRQAVQNKQEVKVITDDDCKKPKVGSNGVFGWKIRA